MTDESVECNSVDVLDKDGIFVSISKGDMMTVMPPELRVINQLDPDMPSAKHSFDVREFFLRGYYDLTVVRITQVPLGNNESLAMVGFKSKFGVKSVPVSDLMFIPAK
ncbi:MAG: hypothetical protein QM490_02415 [Candidatus Gracilibacteria bacterium]